MTSMLANDARVEDLRSMIDGLLKETDTYGQLRRALDAQGAGDAGPAGQRAALAKLVAAVERSPAPELLTAAASFPRRRPVCGRWLRCFGFAP